MGLSTSELASLRTAAESWLTETCAIQEKTLTSDNMGGYTETWATVTGCGSVACRLAPMQSRDGETVDGAQLRSISDWVLTLHWDQALTAANRVVHGGLTYEVTRVEDAHTNRTAKRAYLKRVN